MSINTSSPFLFVDQGVGPYIGQNGPAAGMVRFNTSNQHLEAFDGNIWTRIAENQNIGMTGEAVDAIRWARYRMGEDQRLKQLAEKHPGVADAVDQLKRASEQLEIMVQLVNEDTV